MVGVPVNEVTQADLIEWYRLQDELKRVKAAEMLLRTKIFKGKFPAPVEGTNSTPLDAGWVLKGKYTVNREIDPGALGANTDRLIAAGIIKEELVNYKPSLVLSAYRELTAEQAHLFDECLIIKPGAPALEIVLPKAKGKVA